jgi:hypothetical protein
VRASSGGRVRHMNRAHVRASSGTRVRHMNLAGTSATSPAAGGVRRVSYRQPEILLAFPQETSHVCAHEYPFANYFFRFSPSRCSSA